MSQGETTYTHTHRAVFLQSLLQPLLDQEMSKLFNQAQNKQKYGNSSSSQLGVAPKVAEMAQTPARSSGDSVL